MRTRRLWTPEEDKILREKYENYEAEEIGKLLGRGKTSVYNRAHLLGLRKPFIYHSLAGKKGTQYPAAIEHRFHKGIIPANKGKKMPADVYARCSVTMFRKGHRPENHREVGSERVNVDGYIEIKVAEPNKWRLKHRVVWEQSFGPIPKGHNVQFRNGNRQDCSLENLYLISRSEQLVKQNSLIARYPEDLQKVIRLKGALKRQINKHNKTQNHE